MTNVIVRTTENIIATLRPKQGIQCEENILYLFDPNVVVSITEATSRQWLEQQSEAYLNEYIKPVMDAYEEEKERDIDAYVEEKQSTIFFDNTNFTGTTTAEQINVSGDFSADNITTNTLTVLSSATIPAPTTDNNPATKKYVDDAVAGSTAGYHPDLFAHEWVDYIKNNVSWLRADTFSWQDGTAYEGPYQHLVDDIDGKTIQTETVEGITIQFYEADDGHKICPASEEANVLALYTMSGVAWYYILDTVNQRFKLPRTKWGFVGYRDEVGKYVPESLPPLNYKFRNGSGSGDFGTQQILTDNANTGSIITLETGEIFSTPTNIVGTSDTVQQRATQMYLYFYVGNFTQTAVENTAGLNASLFNNKADTNLNNVSATSGFRRLVEVYNSGADYYKVFEEYNPSDGSYIGKWCEQGGFISMYANNTIINLFKQMRDTNYLAFCSIGGTAYRENAPSIHSKTTTTLKITHNANLNKEFGIYWEVKGYIQE